MNWQKISLVSLFAVAMGYFEAAVLVYLRELFGLGQFIIKAELPKEEVLTNLGIIAFLKNTALPQLGMFSDHHLWQTEIGREAATIVMLATLAILVGRNNWQRLAYFLLAFALWDIFYYVFLYLLIGWPPSLLTLDILFLIPLPWIAPVILPLSISVLMIVASFGILKWQKN